MNEIGRRSSSGSATRKVGRSELREQVQSSAGAEELARSTAPVPLRCPAKMRIGAALLDCAASVIPRSWLAGWLADRSIDRSVEFIIRSQGSESRGSNSRENRLHRLLVVVAKCHHNVLRRQSQVYVL